MYRSSAALLIVGGDLGGPLGGSRSWLKCIAAPTCRVLPLVKYFPILFSKYMYFDLPKDYEKAIFTEETGRE